MSIKDKIFQEFIKANNVEKQPDFSSKKVKYIFHITRGKSGLSISLNYLLQASLS